MKPSALALAAASIAAACSSSGDRRAAPAGAAGDVTEERGDVRAIHDGASRALVVGGVVSADDVVKTGADGFVTIVLRHNRVAWSIGPGREKKVSDSAAWTAAAGAGPEEVTGDHSAAAGRHGERSATETSASAPGGSAMAGSGSAMAGSGSGSASGESFGQGSGPGSLEGGHAVVAHVDFTVAATGGVAQRLAEMIVRRNLDPVRACYEQELHRDPTAAGTLVIRAHVGADGAVTTVVGSSTVADAIGACMSRAVAAVAFPRGAAGELAITFTLSAE